MSRDEIIAMAREAGFVLADNATDEALNRFRAFAALVAAREREACAATVEQMTARSRWIRGGINGEATKPCEYAAAIRARGADPDLARLIERGATAWAGVDAQALREGRMPHNAQSKPPAESGSA